MAYNLNTEQQVKDFFGSTRHVRGTILRARFVGYIPALVKDGYQLLPSQDCWDFLIRTPKNRYVVVRGQHHEHGQPVVGNDESHTTFSNGYPRRKDAEALFERRAKVAEPVSKDRGGGAAWGGLYRSPAEYAELRAAGEVTNKE